MGVLGVAMLVVVGGPDRGLPVGLTQTSMLIGSDPKRSHIAAAAAAPQHAELRLDGHQWVLRDLGSSGGTMLNDQRLTSPAVVDTGDLIQVGSTQLLFCSEVPTQPMESTSDPEVSTARLAVMGETVAHLSHHIRNILQGMQGGSEVVELGFRKRNLETAESGWSMVRRNLDRTMHLAMNMLTFSKQRQPRLQPADVNRMVCDAVGLAQSRADEKGVKLITDLEVFPGIFSDPDGIHQVAQNILSNAIEAAPPETGQVTIRTGHDEVRDEIFLAISDNGPGIPPSEHAKLFEVFHSTKGLGGTGLGLAAAQKIVRELNGRIEVQSGRGRGTTFLVVLPIQPARGAAFL